jgi:hypothetical protein
MLCSTNTRVHSSLNKQIICKCTAGSLYLGEELQICCHCKERSCNSKHV